MSRAEDTRRKATILGVVAIGLAAGTGWLMYSLIQGYEREVDAANARVQEQTVVVALVDIPPFSPITAEQVTLASLSAAEGTAERYYRSIDEVVGEEANVTVLVGEGIREERLSDAGRSVSSVLLVQGSRAVTVKVSRDAGVGGLLVPGDFVDVIVTIRPDSGGLNANWVTETILQGLRVLAIGDEILGQELAEIETNDEKKNRAPSRSVLVTVELLPDEAEKLALAASRGDLHMSLRAEDDLELEVQRGPLVTNALVGLTEPGKKPKPRPRRKKAKAEPAPVLETAEIISGRKTEVQAFDAEGRRIEQKK